MGAVGDLDSHRSFSGDGRFDPDIGRRHIQLDVVRQPGNFRNLCSKLRHELIAGHAGTAGNIGHLCADAEHVKHFHQAGRCLAQFLIRHASALSGRLFQKIKGGEFIGDLLLFRLVFGDLAGYFFKFPGRLFLRQARSAFAAGFFARSLLLFPAFVFLFLSGFFPFL